MRKGLQKAITLWVENGYTTVGESGAGLTPDDASFIKLLVDEKMLPVDMVVVVKASYVPAAEAASKEIMEKYNRKAQENFVPGQIPRYLNRVRIQGIKFWVRRGGLQNHVPRSTVLQLLFLQFGVLQACSHMPPSCVLPAAEGDP